MTATAAARSRSRCRGRRGRRCSVIASVGPASISGESSGGGPASTQHVVHGAQAGALRGVDLGADQLVEVRRAIHENSPSNRSARRASALRVRVFTVPSGMCRYSATSLCDSSLQYASSRTSRSFSGSSSSARWTRHATNEPRRGPRGPARPTPYREPPPAGRSSRAADRRSRCGRRCTARAPPGRARDGSSGRSARRRRTSPAPHPRRAGGRADGGARGRRPAGRTARRAVRTPRGRDRPRGSSRSVSLSRSEAASPGCPVGCGRRNGPQARWGVERQLHVLPVFTHRSPFRFHKS